MQLDQEALLVILVCPKAREYWHPRGVTGDLCEKFLLLVSPCRVSPSEAVIFFSVSLEIHVMLRTLSRCSITVEQTSLLNTARLCSQG